MLSGGPSHLSVDTGSLICSTDPASLNQRSITPNNGYLHTIPEHPSPSSARPVCPGNCKAILSTGPVDPRGVALGWIKLASP